jgi:hypothetical protein
MPPRSEQILRYLKSHAIWPPRLFTFRQLRTSQSWPVMLNACQCWSAFNKAVASLFIYDYHYRWPMRSSGRPNLIGGAGHMTGQWQFRLQGMITFPYLISCLQTGHNMIILGFTKALGVLNTITQTTRKRNSKRWHRNFNLPFVGWPQSRYASIFSHPLKYAVCLGTVVAAVPVITRKWPLTLITKKTSRYMVQSENAASGHKGK